MMPFLDPNRLAKRSVTLTDVSVFMILTIAGAVSLILAQLSADSTAPHLSRVLAVVFIILAPAFNFSFVRVKAQAADEYVRSEYKSAVFSALLWVILFLVFTTLWSNLSVETSHIFTSRQMVFGMIWFGALYAYLMVRWSFAKTIIV